MTINFDAFQKQIVKGKELLLELERQAPPGADEATLPTLDEASPAASRASSILDLASSLQTQLSKFGHRLDDTRERLEDTSRCYELLDKVKNLT